ncbi:flagellar basal body rod modification protein [bacterium BMS3Abin03]|nr:flagellar basal body rod modification protein [bacterium BMS3Abin03]
MFSKAKILILSIILISSIQSVNAQWDNEWTSPQIQTGVISGWLNFQEAGSDWQTRLYTIDSLTFQIMQEGYSFTPQYIYTFTASERLAGNQIFSLSVDLTGDNITEFYVLGFEGAGSPYRQTFKIIDITTGSVLFERNDPAYSYSVPSIWDVDNDGILEAVFSRFDYPSLSNYTLEAYSTGVATSVKGNAPIMKFELEQNYPNPFNPTTTIEYNLNSSENVQLNIFDIKGERIKTLVNDFQPAGNYKVQWNGTNSRGSKLSSGVYFYSIKTGGSVSTKKMILLK